MEFVKMEGLRNDFIVLEGPVEPSPDQIVAWCDRRSGVGADGVLEATPLASDRVRMRYWNADGRPAEMCGNGLRCVARLAVDRNWVEGRSFTVQTDAGDLPVHVMDGGSVRALVGRPTRGRVPSLEVAGTVVTPIRVGNPHAVLFVEDPQQAPVAELGRKIEKAPIFPDGTNVEFVDVVDRHRIRMRIWERGVGETMASGTGATAAAYAALLADQVESPVVVELPGGELTIEFVDDEAWMTGPAHHVFRGVIDADLT